MKDIQNKLIDKFVNTGWLGKMRFFLESSDFYDLLLSLKMEVEEGHRFTPGLKDVFKPFELTHYNNLKVVFITEGPYQNPLLNSGLALSSLEGIKPPHSLKVLLENCKSHTIEGNDLTNWAKQGVLLLNGSLTRRIMGSNQEKVWVSFNSTLFDVLNRKDDLPIVFFGEGKKYASMLNNSTHLKIYLEELPEYPILEWDSKDMFLKINEFLESKKLLKIIW